VKTNYDKFYNAVAAALETGNTEEAGVRMANAYEYLGESEGEKLERELTADYYEFT
jgi:hypothetical protein